MLQGNEVNGKGGISRYAPVLRGLMDKRAGDLLNGSGPDLAGESPGFSPMLAGFWRGAGGL